MKKLIALALFAAVLLSGCASRADYEKLQQQYRELESSYEEVLAENEALLEIRQKYEPVLEALEQEDYVSAGALVGEMQTQKQQAEFGQLQPHLMTVELTEENFGDYFRWEIVRNINEFGEVDSSYVWYTLVSTVYDQGWILYSADAAIGFDYTMIYADPLRGEQKYSSGEITESIMTQELPRPGYGGTTDTIALLDRCTIETTRVKGTVTFVSADYIAGTKLGDVWDGFHQTFEITLGNGETLSHIIHYGSRY